MNILGVAACCILAFVLGIAFLYGCFRAAIYHRNKKDSLNEPRTKKLGTMDVILIIIGMILLLFTVAMIIIFVTVGSVPDTLITCVFAALGGECGAMAWIKNTKERRQERKWQLEDEKKE